jgi:protein O-mannosyl-transferase
LADKKKYNNTLLTCICVTAIAIITYFIFSPSLDGGFTNWDDQAYVLNNPLVVNNSVPLVNIFETTVAANYHPLTVLSLALNYQTGKLDPFGYHLENVIFHVLNTILVFLFIFLLTRRNLLMAAIVSLFFGIHPMHVESVAWISERKDVLYVFFFLLGLITYLRYSETKKIVWYLFTILLFILSCLSKGMAVVFPVILLLIDYLRGEKRERRLLIEKIPFFILSIVFGIIAFKVQQSAQVYVDIKTFTIFQRLMFACYGAIMYIVKLFAPYKLSAFYPYPDVSNSIPLIFYFSPFILLGILSALVYFFRKKEKEIVFGLLFYFVSVVLVLQFVSAGRVIMADRYSYLSYTGLLFVLAYLIDKEWQNKNSVLKYLIMIITVIYAVTFSYQAYSRTQVWKNSETLWTDVIDNYPDVFMAYKSRADYYIIINEPKQAIANYTKAILLDSTNAEAYNNRGLLYMNTGNNDLAFVDFNKTIALNPAYAKAYANRGLIYLRYGKNDLALTDFNKAIALDASSPTFYYNRGVYYNTHNNYEEALDDFTKGIQLNPKNVELYYNMRGLCNVNSQKYNEAIADFSSAINLNPSVAGYWLNRSFAESKIGQNEAAKADEIKGQQLKAPHP